MTDIVECELLGSHTVCMGAVLRAEIERLRALVRDYGRKAGLRSWTIETSLLAEWENHAGPYKDAEIERLRQDNTEMRELINTLAGGPRTGAQAMTPRDLLIGVWPWSLPDETASQGADMVLKAFDVAGYAIVPKAEIERLRRWIYATARSLEKSGLSLEEYNAITAEVCHALEHKP